MQQKPKPTFPGRGCKRLIPLFLAGALALLPLAVSAEEAGYWERIAHVIAAMDNGGENEVLAQIEPGEGVPSVILQVLQNRDVTLVILCDGKRLRINGKQMYPVSGGQGSYSWEDLSTTYATPPSPGEVSSEPPLEPSALESSDPESEPEPSDAASTGAILSHELPPREESSIPVASVPPEQELPSEPSSEQEEYLPVSARTELHRPVYPLVIAGGVILVAAAGGGAAIYLGILRDRLRKKQDDPSEASDAEGEGEGADSGEPKQPGQTAPSASPEKAEKPAPAAAE